MVHYIIFLCQFAEDSGERRIITCWMCTPIVDMLPLSLCEFSRTDLEMMTYDLIVRRFVLDYIPCNM